MDLKEIRTKLALILADVEKAGEWTEDQKTEYAKLESRMNTAAELAEKRSALDARDKKLSEFSGQPTADIRSDMPRYEIRGSQQYKSIFNKYFFRGMQGLTSAEQRIITTLSDSGVATPEYWDKQIEADIKEANVLRQYVQVKPTAGDENITTATSAAAAWGAETASITGGDPTFGTKKLSSHRLTGRSQVSIKSLTNSVADPSWYLSDLAAILGAKELNGMLSGQGGSDDPTGLAYQATSGVNLAGASPTADEVITFLRVIPQQLRAGSIIFARPSVVTDIRLLTSGGTGEFIWRPGFAGTPDQLDGFPLIETDHLPEDRPMLMIQPKKVIIGDNGPMILNRDDITGIANAVVNFWAIKFVDILLRHDSAAAVMCVLTSTEEGLS